jgi:hypothetical protein
MRDAWQSAARCLADSPSACRVEGHWLTVATRLLMSSPNGSGQKSNHRPQARNVSEAGAAPTAQNQLPKQKHQIECQDSGISSPFLHSQEFKSHQAGNPTRNTITIEVRNLLYYEFRKGPLAPKDVYSAHRNNQRQTHGRRTL